MIEFSLKDLSVESFNNAKEVAKDVILSRSPELDLKDGTALADLLIGPGAQILAFNSLNTDYVRRTMSLKLLKENPELITNEALDNLASNYNIVRRTGAKASGTVMVRVSSNQEYTVEAGYSLAIGALTYETSQDWRLRNGSVDDPLTELELRTDSSGVTYFLLPMVASQTGAIYNVPANMAMTVVTNGVPNFISAGTYSDFGGGTDDESNEQLLARIPIAMSHSEFSSVASISTRLMNAFSNIHDVSVVGMGDPEMLRDKHNVFGVAFGGRVDIYLKTFRHPYTKVLQVTASKVSDGVYTFTLNATNAPGYYCIRSITSPDSFLTLESDFQLPAIGSFPFTEKRTGYNTGSTFHDFSSNPSLLTRETAYSIWQESVITVTNIPATIIDGAPEYPDTLPLKVEVYVPDRLIEIQSYVDGAAIANKESDMVVKSGLLAFVSVTADVYRKSSVVLDMNAMKQAVVDYINGKTFGDSVTISQLSSIMHKFDIVRVGLDNSAAGVQLEAKILGTDGVWRTINGSDLDVSSVEEASAGITAKTVIMVADPRSVFLTEKVI